MTLASIVVPSYRGARRLPVLLDSLARQTEDDFEVVVAVDGDVDGTADLLAARTDLDLRPVVLRENRGRATALNAGLSTARGEVLIRCDDDLELPPTFVANHVSAHRHDRVGIVGPCRNVYADDAYATAYGRPADEDLARAQVGAGPEIAWRFWGGNVSVTREDHDRIGEYDAATFDRYGWEDADWGYRLWRAGCPVRVEPDAWALHHGASTSTAVRAGRAYDSGWSQAAFEAKHGVVLDGRGAPPRSAWQRMVSAYASHLDAADVARRGARVDAHLSRWPRPLARKRVALLVEAAGRAGYLSARTGRTEGSLVP